MEAKNPGDRELLSAVRAHVISSVRLATTVGSMLFVFMIVSVITLYNVLQAIGHCDDSDCDRSTAAAHSEPTSLGALDPTLPGPRCAAAP